MDKKMKTIGAIIIGSAIIWGAVIVGSALALRGTGCYDQIQNILVGGILGHIVLIWSPLALQAKNKQEK